VVGAYAVGAWNIKILAGAQPLIPMHHFVVVPELLHIAKIRRDEHKKSRPEGFDPVTHKLAAFVVVEAKGWV
jgi:hypothetical protein